MGRLEDADTAALLQRWHRGDRGALDALLAEHLSWIESAVRQARGPHLRAQAETGDHVHDVVLKVLSYGPRFVAGGAQFRGLMARIVHNVLCDAHRRARYRDHGPIPRDSVLSLDHSVPPPIRPSEAAAANEERALMHLALEFLDGPTRALIDRRQSDSRSFAEIGVELGVSEATARQRFHRAIVKIAGIVDRLRKGKLDELLREERSES